MKSIYFILILFSFYFICNATHSNRINIEPKEQVLNGWTKKNKPNPNKKIILLFALRHSNANKLEGLINRVSDPDSKFYGDFLPYEVIGEITQPPKKNLHTLLNWLNKNRINNFEISGHKDFVKVTTTIKKAEELLATEFHVYQHENSVVDLVRAEKYTVPVELANILDFVGNVKRLPRITKRNVRKFDGSVDAYITPAVIRSDFGVNTKGNPNNTNQQAVAQFLGQYYNPQDLAMFLKQHNIKDIKVYKEEGPNDPNNPGAEASLDIEYIIGVNQGTKTWFESTAGRHDGQEPFLKWLYALENTTDIPLVTSVSYGDVESSLDVTFMKSVSLQFQKLGASGHTIVYASGDSGCGCNAQATRFEPDFPASSPYVLAVGGIQSLHVGDTISGGGFSNVFAATEYQKDVISRYLVRPGVPSTSYFNVSGRAYPDVCSFSENVVITVNQLNFLVGGTSCAAPVVSSMISLLNDIRLSANKPPIGWPVPLFYKLHSLYSTAFTDIIQGRNTNGNCPGYPATISYDTVTGLGTFNFTQLSKVINNF